MAANTKTNRPLRQIAEAFEELALALKSGSGDIQLAPFCRACSRVSVLFGYLGIAFKFAEKDFVDKIQSLTEASSSSATLQALVDSDIKSGSVRGGSYSNNLLLVKRGLDMVKVLFERLLVTRGSSLRDPASVAYAQVLAPHHGWAIRKVVAAGMYTLPTKSQLLKKLNEDEASARVDMQKYINASASILQYVNNLFLSRNLDI
uniref:Glycolipid transfer protein domain-containing protein n=1 Tax=Picea sitchensis TaxID=3332 RepID=D5ACB1_PICSI|nr:unknown [Picea sitchensis]